MKQTTLLSTILELTFGGFMEKKLAKPPLSQKGNQIHPKQMIPKKFVIFPAPSCKIQKKLAPTKEKFVGRGAYIKDTNTETCQGGEPKVGNVEITIKIIFFV